MQNICLTLEVLELLRERVKVQASNVGGVGFATTFSKGDRKGSIIGNIRREFSSQLGEGVEVRLKVLLFPAKNKKGTEHSCFVVRVVGLLG